MPAHREVATTKRRYRMLKPFYRKPAVLENLVSCNDKTALQDVETVYCDSAYLRMCRKLQQQNSTMER